MSSEKKRPYRKQARARQEAKTRQRITEAVVELHRCVGPAKTTISEVAARAGVGRMTVYKHFPTEAELFQACSTHWGAQNPPPDFSPCLAREPHKRARCILECLYAYYRQNHDMLGNIQRDAPLLPALQSVMEQGWLPLLRELEAALLAGSSTVRRRATARVVLDLHTWEILAAAGLGDRQAAELAAAWLSAE